MVNITIYGRSDRIKICDEQTYQEVELNFECSEEKDSFCFLEQYLFNLGSKVHYRPFA